MSHCSSYWLLTILLLLCSIALACIAVTSCESPTEVLLDESVFIKPDVVDFGDVGQGEVHTAEYTVLNRFVQPVEIETVRTLCSCAKFEYSPKVISPGGQAKVKIYWNSGENRGSVSLDMLLILKYPDGQKVVRSLRIHAKVMPDIIVIPETLDFTNTKAEADTLVLNFAPGKQKEFAILQATSSHEAFQVECSPALLNQVRVTLTPGSWRFTYPVFINVKTDSKNQPVISVPIILNGSSFNSPHVLPGEKP